LALEPGKAPIVAVIGLGWLLGSAVLAWFSSPATLHLVRDHEEHVTAAIESKLFGLFTTRAERIEGIRSLSVVRYSNSDTPSRIVFETAKGAVDLGRNQQLFAPDYAEIDSALKTLGPVDLTLSSIARGSELRRFVIAQGVTLFLFLVGLGLVWVVISHLRGR
jgi:hypothetical protein